MVKKGAIPRGIAGVDEAGRGPLIGPMIICGILVEPDKISELASIGVRDSKKLTSLHRLRLKTRIETIVDKIVIRSVSASDIDSLRRHVTMNEIEVNEFVEILKILSPLKAFLDAADVNAARFGQIIGNRSGLILKGTQIVSEHNADSKYPIVSAASILAKVERDRIITELHNRYGDFGSGYPADPKTIEFVKNILQSGKKLPPIVRKSWESVRRITDEVKNTRAY